MRGHTLFELLIVLVIIGIIAVVSISSYKSYLVRVQVNAAVNILYMQQLAITKYYEIHGVMPTTENVPEISGPPFVTETVTETNIPDSSADIIKVEIQFSDTADEEISNKSVVIEGKYKEKEKSWTWLCRNSTDSNGIKNKYLPHQCQYTGHSCPASFCLAEED